MSIIVEPQRSQLYRRIRNLLGAPLRGVELEDEQMDSLMELSIGDYTQYVLNWLIDSQWTSLYGINLDERSVTKALVTRSLDWETQYTYAYSKIVGLQAGGDWVLKKDYVDLLPNQQIYEIPAGREINELLWFMRAELNNSLFDPFMGGFGGFGGTGLGGPGGFAQFGASGSYFMMPAFDVVLRMADRNLKQRMIVGDLTYRITALPEGKKALHLYNVPGGKFDFSNIGFNEYRCWYWYYDTIDADRDDCLANNPDIVKLPSDIPLESLSWNELNVPAQQWIRRWFTAYCKETLSRVWGKYSGNLKTPDSELTLDYASLQTESKDEKTKLLEELIGPEGTLTRLRPEKVMEREALIAENLNKQLKFRAFPSNYFVI
jgi:hypothetical protein